MTTFAYLITGSVCANTASYLFIPIIYNHAL